ncbi:uncharacterized protein LOC119767866 [Culex quinquefasciatus]|uniref:uncharacterized protein LOC119765554 n=1 Tax=Culex quinquefasciatus TaxID=7176 RepID=UPI0018E38547|nr:uncharacterized protein LOC119765554 [Culex quinquefasciatus]XP_038113526.1 uncharacterized protein LOC119767866 [Culex quinquefasciatus]
MNVAILSITMVLGMIDILTRCCCVPDSARERKAGGLPGKCRIDIDGYLIEIVICLMNGNRTNSVASRTWRRSLNSAIKASLVLLVHDKNVYNCATKIRPATDRPRQCCLRENC